MLSIKNCYSLCFESIEIRHDSLLTNYDDMKACFICRGYPGLGKVVGAVALNAMLKQTYRNQYQSLFLTYYSGYEFLKSENYNVVNVLSNNLQIARNSFCTPFGLETQNCVNAILAFQPDVIINDGEPYLIEVTQDILKIPTIVLAHPADLGSPANSKSAIDLFRYYYSKATLVIAHGFQRLPDGRGWLGGKAGNVREINTIIRDGIYQHSLINLSYQCRRAIAILTRL